ncbi:MAG TPA: DUF1579 family protein [Candidatus Cryosericum sp.]|nr:DUF1579 family protein [Candidatus Cryosericum sp.]
MRAKSLAVASCLVFTVGLSLADAPAGKPVPGPEHKKLAYFVGKWTMTGEMKPSPIMPGGTMSGNDVCEWFDGGFAVVCRTEGKGPMGPTKSLGIMGYSTEEKAYTYYGLDNGPMTMATVPRGTVQAGTWTYTDESMMGGKKVKSRYVMKELSPTAYTFKWEVLGEDGAWQTLVEGKSTKAS